MTNKAAKRSLSLRQRYTATFLPLFTGLFLLTMVGVIAQSIHDQSREYRDFRKIINNVVDINLEVIQEANGIYDTLFGKDIETKLKAMKEAFDASGDDPQSLDLEALKQSWGEEWDLYVIDSEETIIATTYPPDLGMAFHEFAGPFARKLREIRLSGGLTLDKITFESSGFGYRKFGYLPTDDRKYVLEVGLRIPIEDPLFQPINPEFVGSLYTSLLEETFSIDIYQIANLLDESREPITAVRRDMKASGEQYREVWNWSEGTVTTYMNSGKSRDSQYPTAEEYFVVSTFSLDGFKSDILRIVLLQLAQLLIILIIGLILINHVSRTFARPIHDMVEDISMIANGYWKHEIRKAGSEEFSILKASVENLVGSLVKEKEAAESRKNTIERLAYKDIVSELPNLQAYYNRRFEKKDEPSALVLLNLDDFTRVNTAFGHIVGNEVIRAFAKEISQLMEQNVDASLWDLYHVHLDELLLVTTEEDVSVAEKAIRGLFDELSTGLFLTAGRDFFFTVSAGAVLGDGEAATTEQELLRRAGMAVVKAKELGKNVLVFYDENFSVDYRNTYALVHGIWEGIVNNSLKLVYQPIVDIMGRKPMGFEALLRTGPDVEASPLATIKAAEDSGLIHPLGKWIIRDAIRQARAFEEAGIEISYISINISPLQFREQGLPQHIADMCNRVGVPTDRIQLEITETALMRSEARMVSVIHELKDLGFRIAMDDFGTGYSSLAYLSRLPIDVIKIEKYMTNEALRDSKVRSVVLLIMEIARKLHLEVIAEGIESDEHARWMAEQSCENHQGYHYSQPMDADRVAAWMEEFKKNRQTTI